MRDEPFRSFASRVSKAETCEFQIDHKCLCGLTNSVDYTDHAMWDVLVAGIYDSDIRRDILGVEGIIAKSVNGVVFLVGWREMARNALEMSGNASAISRGQEVSITRRTSPREFRPPQRLTKPCPANKDQKGPCSQCRQQFLLFSEGQKGWNTKPREFCKNCFRLRRQNRSKGNKAPLVGTSVSGIYENPDSLQAISQISVISSATYHNGSIAYNSSRY